MFDTSLEAIDCIKGDVVLVQDKCTGLIFNSAFQPELVQYNAGYQNEQACSTTFRKHLARVAEIIRKHFDGYSLIEVGCGKGYFLEHLQQVGFRVTGLDPTYEGDNPGIVKEYFRPALGLHGDAIVLRHVLEHVPDPVTFLTELRDSNGGHGKIYVEVPCFEWICDRRAWFDIFYEHVNYFRLDDFHRMFGHVYESGHLFSGQYLYVVADLASVRRPSADKAPNFKFPADFLESVDRYATELKQKQTAIWGGASKGVVFALFMQRAGASVECVIDINPAKQGKFLASTGLQVRSPHEALGTLEPDACVFVMNSNYYDEVVAEISRWRRQMRVETV
jgi:SAM-dependent methyltransferase